MDYINTQFLTVEDVVHIIKTVGLEGVLDDISQYIIADYVRWDEFEKASRTANHSELGVIELMPISDSVLYSFKYVNGHPRNFVFGLPTVMAFGVLSNVGTGRPILLTELTLTTALRTAAMSAAVANTLARGNSKTMAVIGNGAQAEFQVLAFYYQLGIKEFTVYDIDPLATERLIKNLSEYSDINIKKCSSIKEAAFGADIVTTLTADKANATILTLDMISPGTHINAVGGDCPGKTELHVDILKNSTVFVEYEPQTRIEGDIQQMPKDFPVTSMSRVWSGTAQGRLTEEEITVFDSVGFALEDFSTMKYLWETSTDLGMWRAIRLIPHLQDPKNLYGLI